MLISFSRIAFNDKYVPNGNFSLSIFWYDFITQRVIPKIDDKKMQIKILTGPTQSPITEIKSKSP